MEHYITHWYGGDEAFHHRHTGMVVMEHYITHTGMVVMEHYIRHTLVWW